MFSSKPRQACRVLYLDHTAMLGGGELALLHLVTHLDAARYHPVVVLSSPGDLVERLEQAGIETHVLPLHPSIVHTRKDTLGASSALRLRDAARILTYSIRLAAFIRRQNVCIVHTNSLKSDIFGGIAARLSRTPLIWHVRDRISSDYLPGVVCRIFRAMCRKLPDFVIANSQATMSTLRLPMNKPAAVVYSGKLGSQVVHDGIVAPSACSPCADAPPKLDAGPRIGLVGRIAPWKGQDVFIRAAVSVCRRFPNARFLMAGSAMFGETEYEDELRELVNQHGLQDRVEFLGFREDISAFIESLDVLVHASTVAEPFGQVVIEGMAAAKPVVATRGGGVLEIVDDGVTGLLVKMGSEDEMADAICAVLADPAYASALGHAARRAVLDRFTIAQTAASVQAIYDVVLRTKRGVQPCREDAEPPSAASAALLPREQKKSA